MLARFDDWIFGKLPPTPPVELFPLLLTLLGAVFWMGLLTFLIGLVAVWLVGVVEITVVLFGVEFVNVFKVNGRLFTAEMGMAFNPLIWMGMAPWGKVEPANMILEGFPLLVPAPAAATGLGFCGKNTVEAGAATLLMVVFLGSEANEVTATGMAVAYSAIPSADTLMLPASSCFIPSKISLMESVPTGLGSCMTTFPTSGNSCTTVNLEADEPGSIAESCNVCMPPPFTWTCKVDPGLVASGGRPWMAILSPEGV